MEIALDLNLLLTLCTIGFVAGVIDAIAGGGGMLTIPALLTAGLPPHLALGTNKVAASFGSFTASITFYRKKLFNIRFWRWSIVATAIGAVIGTLVIDLLPVELLEKALPVVIVMTAIYTLLAKSNIHQENTLPQETPSLRAKQTGQGLILGFYDGVAGPGTGAFWTASSSALYKINILMSLGLARSTNFISNFVSLVTFIYLGYVNFLIGISMGIFMMIGAWVGANWAIKFGSKYIRPVFILVVITMSINLAYQAWF